MSEFILKEIKHKAEQYPSQGAFMPTPATDPYLKQFGIHEEFIQCLKKYAVDNPSKTGGEACWTPLQMYWVMKSMSMMPAFAAEVFDRWAPNAKMHLDQMPPEMKDQYLKMINAVQCLIKKAA